MLERQVLWLIWTGRVRRLLAEGVQALGLAPALGRFVEAQPFLAHFHPGVGLHRGVPSDPQAERVVGSSLTSRARAPRSSVTSLYTSIL